MVWKVKNNLGNFLLYVGIGALLALLIGESTKDTMNVSRTSSVYSEHAFVLDTYGVVDIVSRLVDDPSLPKVQLYYEADGITGIFFTDDISGKFNMISGRFISVGDLGDSVVVAGKGIAGYDDVIEPERGLTIEGVRYSLIGVAGYKDMYTQYDYTCFVPLMCVYPQLANAQLVIDGLAPDIAKFKAYLSVNFPGKYGILPVKKVGLREIYHSRIDDQYMILLMIVFAFAFTILEHCLAFALKKSIIHVHNILGYGRKHIFLYVVRRTVLAKVIGGMLGALSISIAMHYSYLPISIITTALGTGLLLSTYFCTTYHVLRLVRIYK